MSKSISEVPFPTTTPAIVDDDDSFMVTHDDSSSSISLCPTCRTSALFSLSRMIRGREQSLASSSVPRRRSINSSDSDVEMGVPELPEVMAEPSESSSSDVVSDSSLGRGYHGNVEERPIADSGRPTATSAVVPLTWEERIGWFLLNSSGHGSQSTYAKQSTEQFWQLHEQDKNPTHRIHHTSSMTIDTDVDCESNSSLNTTTTLQHEEQHNTNSRIQLFASFQVSLANHHSSSALLRHSAIFNPPNSNNQPREEGCTSYLFSIFVGLSVLAIAIVYLLVL